MRASASVCCNASCDGAEQRIGIVTALQHSVLAAAAALVFSAISRLQHWAPTCSLQQILSAAMRCERWCVRCMCFAFAVGERAQPHAPLLMSRQRATDKGGTALVCLWYSVACQALSTLVTVWLIAVVIFNSIKPTACLFGFDTCVRCVSCAMHFVLGACRVRCDLFTRCVECDSMQRVHLRFTDVKTRREEKRKVRKNKRGEGTGQENKE